MRRLGFIPIRPGLIGRTKPTLPLGTFSVRVPSVPLSAVLVPRLARHQLAILSRGGGIVKCSCGDINKSLPIPNPNPIPTPVSEEKLSFSQQDKTKRKNSICVSYFPDGCIHRIKTCHKQSITKFVTTKYQKNQKHQKQKPTIYQDSLVLRKHKNLKLGYDASRSLTVENAGGNSEYSEAISMHYFEHVFRGKDFILENEVQYWSNYKMVDYICTIGKERIGISVTRAMGYPCSSLFTKKDAKELLYKKIKGLIVACDLVVKKHSFKKSILHIWCQNQRIANVMKETYEQEIKIDSMKLKVLCDVTLILTVCRNKSIYTNRKPYKARQMNIV